MHVGTALIFQGTDPSRSDREVYEQEIRLGMLDLLQGLCA